MSSAQSTHAIVDTQPISRWERWPSHWIGAAAGAAAGLGDVLVMFALGVEMRLGGVDAAFVVLALLAVTYAVLGYMIGRLGQEQARSKRSHAIIERQYRELERAQRNLEKQTRARVATILKRSREFDEDTSAGYRPERQKAWLRRVTVELAETQRWTGTR